MCGSRHGSLRPIRGSGRVPLPFRPTIASLEYPRTETNSPRVTTQFPPFADSSGEPNANDRVWVGSAPSAL